MFIVIQCLLFLWEHKDKRDLGIDAGISGGTPRTGFLAYSSERTSEAIEDIRVVGSRQYYVGITWVNGTLLEWKCDGRKSLPLCIS